jgi:hypothetical protein
VRRQLAHQYGTRLLQALRDEGIGPRHVVGQNSGVSRGRDASHINDVFQANRHAMQRTLPVARLDGGLRLSGLL